MTKGSLTIGIDLGGTEMKGGLVNAEGELMHEHRVRTPVEEGRDGILRELKTLAHVLIAEAPASVASIGIGSAGRVNPLEGSIVYATNNLPGWTGTRVAQEIEDATGLPVFVDNDVNVAAAGEAWMGAAKGYQSFALVALGTGVGGALVYGGQLLHGASGGAGEIGHMILQPGGRPCNCGQHGCLEQYVSGTALQRSAREANSEWTSRKLLELCGEGHDLAVQLVDEFVQHLANGLISLKNLYDPEHIVLGGGVADAWAIWGPRLEQSLSALTPKPIPVSPALLRNKAGIIGAARLQAMRAARS